MKPTDRRLAATLLVSGVVLANAAFLGLGLVFEYPDILQQPASQVLTKFRADESVIVAFFLFLALGAGLLAPVAVLLGRLVGGRLGRWSAWIGVAAALVQVVGLLRWPLIVPSLAARATDPVASAVERAEAVGTFDLLGTLLGTVVGETLGYLLTAAWTVLLVQGLARRLAGRWFAGVGLASAFLILLGVAVPLGLVGADLANFVGYIVWSLWLVALAVLVWRRQDHRAHRPTDTP